MGIELDGVRVVVPLGTSRETSWLKYVAELLEAIVAMASVAGYNFASIPLDSGATLLIPDSVAHFVTRRRGGSLGSRGRIPPWYAFAF